MTFPIYPNVQCDPVDYYAQPHPTGTTTGGDQITLSVPPVQTSYPNQVGDQQNDFNIFSYDAVTSDLYGGDSHSQTLLESMKADYEDEFHNHRMKPRGLIMKKKSFEEQEKLSKARAEELSALFEMSDNKDMGLNRKATIKAPFMCAPSMGGKALTAKQAADKFTKQKREREGKTKVDPLPVPEEVNKSERPEKPKRRKLVLTRRNKSSASTAPKSGVKKLDNITPPNPANDENAPPSDENVAPNLIGFSGKSNMNMKIPLVRKKGLQMPQAKKRQRISNGYCASNGKIYDDVPNLC